MPVLVFETPLLGPQGEQTGWMGAVVDLTEQQRAEATARASLEQLQATARLASVGEMATLLSHELNQPLSAIASYATGSLNLLSQTDQPPEQVASDMAQAMTRIQEQAERAGRVIHSVGNFVRRREHSGALVREPIAVQQLVQTILPLVNLQARRDGIRVALDISPDCPHLLCDRTMVEQVLLNLARNGMQAMTSPGPDSKATTPTTLRVLTLGARALTPTTAPNSAPWLDISVTDHGHGMSEAVAQKLFTPFFSTRAQGMGLGLSLCRTVVEQHGGTLTHTPAQPCGTAFHLTLPTSPTPQWVGARPA
jgi:two-component system, LuxR family, sensor histidine kinase DctS